MECGVIEQEEETADTRRTTPPTQQQEQKQDMQSEGEGRGNGEEVLEADVWIAGGAPTHTDAEARTEPQPTRPKRPENLKVERRGSPTPTEAGVGRGTCSIKFRGSSNASADCSYHGGRL